MKILICITVFLLLNFLGCSYNKKETPISSDILAGISMEYFYKNIYNEYGKLDTVIIRVGDFPDASYYERHFFYRNDTVLFKIDEYEVQPDGKKTLCSYYKYEDDKNTFVYLSDRDTFEHITLYENERVVNNKRYRNGIIEELEVYEYENINDTLITSVYEENVLKRRTKKIGDKEFFYGQNELVSSREKIQIDKDNYVSLWIQHDINLIDSSFYHLDKMVKIVSTRTGADIYDNIKVTFNEMFVDESADQTYTHVTIFEYDELGNVIKEKQYTEYSD